MLVGASGLLVIAFQEAFCGGWARCFVPFCALVFVACMGDIGKNRS